MSDREFDVELIRAGKRDSSGDEFTQECMEDLVKQFEKADRPLMITDKFSGLLSDTVGYVDSLRIDGPAVMAKGEFLDTVQGNNVQKIFSMGGVELASGGTVDPMDATRKDGVRTVHRFKLTLASFVTDKVK